MAVSFIVAPTATGSTTSLTIAIPAEVQENDLMLLIVESANEVVSITSPSGWVEVPNSLVSIGTPADINATRLTLFYKLATTSESSVVIADAGDHVLGTIAVFRGIDLISPFHKIATGFSESAITSLSFPSVITTADDCMIVNIMTSSAEDADKPSIVGSWSNASLGSLTERVDTNLKHGNGGSIAIATGTLATSGSSGSTTATIFEASFIAYLTLALKTPSASSDGSSNNNIAKKFHSRLNSILSSKRIK